MYYHRSGFLKDTHEVWILFSNDRHSLQGRGIDEIGPFIVRGTVESGFRNISWYLDKYYLQSVFLENLLEPLEVWIQNMENYWLNEEEIWSIGRKSVSHVGYRSSQILPRCESREESIPSQMRYELWLLISSLFSQGGRAMGCVGDCHNWFSLRVTKRRCVSSHFADLSVVCVSGTDYFCSNCATVIECSSG
jgi:hypothetical protein